MESMVQPGRLMITRRFNESFIIRPQANIRALLPVAVLFRSPIVVTLLEADGHDQFRIRIEADKRLTILRAELVGEATLHENSSLLYQDDLDLVDQQRLLKDELLRVDEGRGVLKERITAEGDAAKRDRRSVDRKKINHWKRRDDALLAYRTEIRNKLGDIKEAIKQRTITINGRGYETGPANEMLAKTFMTTAQTMLPATQYHQILQLAEGRLKGNA